MNGFKVGENAVYPGHGVGRILSIEIKEILGSKQTFYSVQIIETGMKIMIPRDNVKSVGLRPIISKEEASKVVSCGFLKRGVKEVKKIPAGIPIHNAGLGWRVDRVSV